MDDEKMTGRHFSVSSSVSEGTAPAGKRFAHAAAPEPEVGSTVPEPAPSPEPEADVQAATGSAGEVVDGSSSTPAVEDGAKALEKKSKHRIALRVLLGVVIVLAVAVAAGAIYINQSIARGRKAFDDSMSQAIEEKGKTVVYNGKTYALNEHMVSVAFIGFDNRTTNSASGNDVAGQSDTIMVVALNTDTGKATGIVIPRDSMVDVDTYISGNYNGTHAMQICLQYSYGSTSEESSELVARCASRVLYGMPIDYYFTLNVEGVGPLNDAVGGVTLVPVQSVPSVGISEGVETTLYGKTAERYVQFRDTSTLTSSLDRQRRQVSYLKAFTSKVLQNATGDPAALLSLYQTAQDYTWTNLGFDQFSYLASTMLAKGMTSFDVVTLDGEMSEGETYAEFHLNQDAVYQTVLDTYYTPVDE
ncbi:MAG: hypothetical protein DBX97_24525 [Collinsella tanakaei]|nr:MAG: hypothetical protein DBX97_24525 [Collinsella tanakaei]